MIFRVKMLVSIILLLVLHGSVVAETTLNINVSGIKDTKSFPVTVKPYFGVGHSLEGAISELKKHNQNPQKVKK
tara:strand:+ start:443 stop:664 length:222 start_codon:yes stop_codon:yes gene_type:complete